MKLTILLPWFGYPAMLKKELLEDINAKIGEALARSPATDVEKNLRALMTSFFGRLDLVTREEFDVQQAVLARTREKLAQLEQRLVELEQAGKRES
ncbi:MAG: accessory factor UbiK family protein [Pseudomonadota bacterium]